MTELDAINEVLRALGNVPASVVDDADEDTILARDGLKTAKRTVLANGWYFNQFDAYELKADISGFVHVPNGTLMVDAEGYVMRGNRLWDTAEQSYVIGAAVTADTIILDVDWNELPATAYQAVVAFARYQSVADLDADKDKVSRLWNEYNLAIAALRNEDLRVRDINVFNSPSISARLGRIRPANRYHN